MPSIRAITFDLDDTLWPVWPAIARAEQAVHDWLACHAPATAQRHDVAALRAWRQRVAAEQPGRAHDLSAMRVAALRAALVDAGDDPALAEPAFEVFFEARQRVDLYQDVVPVLERLSRRLPLVAVTNGNADLERIGIAHLFRDVFSAGRLGVGKPDARIFHAACAAAGVPPGQVLHVGDDWHLDVQAAQAAGLHVAWLRRPDLAQVAPPPDAPLEGALGVPRLADLNQLLILLSTHHEVRPS